MMAAGMSWDERKSESLGTILESLIFLLLPPTHPVIGKTSIDASHALK